jgi:hypothetical protein
VIYVSQPGGIHEFLTVVSEPCFSYAYHKSQLSSAQSQPVAESRGGAVSQSSHVGRVCGASVSSDSNGLYVVNGHTVRTLV